MRPCELLIEYVVNLLANVGSKTKKFPVYPVQSCFQEITFSWILGVK